jgi:signal transduction histidine kinase
VIQKPRGPKILLSSYFLWMGSVTALGMWWVHFALTQMERISELEVKIGLDSGQVVENAGRVKRMLLWESGAYLFSLFCFTTIMVWLHYRELKRTASLQAFFAGMTHELRTPLTGVRLQAEAIADLIGDQSPVTNLVRRLLQDTTRLESQVERSLELARVQGGGKIALQPINLRGLVDRLVKNSFPELRLKWSGVDADSILVMGDPRSLQIVFRNIFENSLRHGQRRGQKELTESTSSVLEVEIRVESVSENLKAGGREHPQSVTLEIVDLESQFEGDLARLGRLFEKGVHSPGAGVGLFLVRSLIKQMKGRVEFSNRTLAGEKGFVTKLTLLRETPISDEKERA